MRRRLLIGALSATCMLSAACATGSPATGRDASRIGRVARNSISAAEIAAVHAYNAFQAVERLRPEFFMRGRGPSSLMLPQHTQLAVYQDNIRLGGIQYLQDIPAAAIHSIQYLSAPEATARFGLNNAGGAILVTTRAR